MAINDLTDKIIQWHTDRKITINGTSEAQLLKLMEEFGELTAAVVREDKHLIVDSLGDMYVVMVAIAELEGTTMEQCIEFAYDEIKDRRGHLNEYGIFIKDEEK